MVKESIQIKVSAEELRRLARIIENAMSITSDGQAGRQRMGPLVTVEDRCRRGDTRMRPLLPFYHRAFREEG